MDGVIENVRVDLGILIYRCIRCEKLTHVRSSGNMCGDFSGWSYFVPILIDGLTRSMDYNLYWRTILDLSREAGFPLILE